MDSSREYRTFKFISTVIAQTLAVSTSLFLAYLVKKHSTKFMKSYKKILYLSIFCNLCSSIIGVCVQTSAVINYPVIYLIPEGILGNLTPTLSHLGLILTGFFMNLNVAILPVQYIYRFFLICRKQTISLPYFLLLCFGFSLLPIAIAYAFIPACWPGPDFGSLAQFLNKPEWLLSNGKIPGFVACRLSELGIATLLNNILFGMVYVIIAFCSIMVILNLRRMRKTTSVKTQKMQSQITLILLIQALIPLVIQVFPQTAGSFASEMSPEVFAYFNILMMVLTAWAPLSYPICTIFIVGSYRCALLYYCRYLLGKKPTKVETITVISKGALGSY